MKTIFLLIFLCTGVCQLFAQISETQTDSINRAVFPLYTNMQTYNALSGFQIPGGASASIFTTAAGHHTDTVDVFLAAVTEEQYVSEEQLAVAQGDPLRHLWVYDRQVFDTSEQYADSLHSFLGNYYTLAVSISESEEHTQAGLLLYPNPAHDYVQLHADGLGGKQVTITVFSSDGRPVLIQAMQAEAGGSAKLDISRLKAGLYFICAEISEPPSKQLRRRIYKGTLICR